MLTQFLRVGHGRAELDTKDAVVDVPSFHPTATFFFPSPTPCTPPETPKPLYVRQGIEK